MALTEGVAAIGHGVTIRLTIWRGHDPAGLVEQHDRADGGGRCQGSIMFALPGVAEAFPGVSVWQVESLEPLTLSPSLLCTRCGHHGWIRGGRWEPA